MLVATSACFTLVPVPEHVPAPMGDVRLHLTTAGATRLLGEGYGMAALDGRLISAENGVLVFVTRSASRGSDMTMDTLRIARAEVTQLARRQVAKGRTIAVYGGLAALVVIVVRTLDSTRGSGDGGGVPGGPPGSQITGGR